MSEQLSLFSTVEDNKPVSSTEVVEDRKNLKHKAIQRFLNSTSNDPQASVGTYSPNGRKTEYYRLLYRIGKKVKAVHIPGGNVNSKLATHRVKLLQQMIDRGADLGELLAAITDYRGGTKPK